VQSSAEIWCKNIRVLRTGGLAGVTALLGVSLMGCARQSVSHSDVAYGRGGQTMWLGSAGSRLKAQAYSSTELSARPTLVVVLHGDLPDPTPSYQYAFAQLITQGVDAPALPDAVRARLKSWTPLENVVAVGILRPGYADNSGDRSDGEMGHAAADNFTPEVVDAIAAATASLRKTLNAGRVVLVGHSGGAAIAADVLGRHPESADAALLVACGCDPEGGRARMRQTRASAIWKGPTRSLQPLDLVSTVRRDVVVRLVVGAQDDVVLPEPSVRYATALKERDVDAAVTVVPALGHNILLTDAALNALATLFSAQRALK
jgi:pimeloyl-ACP methyl ester carboxylesterase